MEDKPIKENLPAAGAGEGEYDEQDKADDIDTRVPVENSYNDVDEDEAVEKMKEKLQAHGTKYILLAA